MRPFSAHVDSPAEWREARANDTILIDCQYLTIREDTQNVIRNGRELEAEG